MATLTIVDTEVQPSTGSQFIIGISGEVIDIGELVRHDDATGTYLLTDVNVASDCQRIDGIAVAAAVAANQRIVIQTTGTVIVGASSGVAAGEVYMGSTTKGKIKPWRDKASNDCISILGVGDASNGIKLSIHNTGINYP